MAQKVCVVFGFGPGIGAACARRWINEGFKVAIIARYYQLISQNISIIMILIRIKIHFL